MKINLLVTTLFLLICSAQNIFSQEMPTLGIINARAIYLPKPEYSDEAKNLCASGKVEVEVLVNESGSVIEAKAISGDDLLRTSSVEAAKKARFGKTGIETSVKVKGIIVYNFDSFNRCPNLGIVNKKALNLPKPSVPDHLKIKKESIVAIKIVVNESGNVIHTNALSGHPILRAVCEVAARYAKFYPTYVTPGIKIPALLIYKFKIDRTIDTDIASDDKDVAVTPTNLVEPLPTWCNCRFGNNPKVTVIVEINEQGNVFKATAVSGHPLLKIASEKAALESTFLPVNSKSKAITDYYFEETDKRSVKFSDVEIRNVEDIRVKK